MADERPPTNGAAGEPRAEPDRRNAPPGTPRWVWALGLIAVVLILILIAAQLLFGIQHGPGLHGPAGGTGTATPTASAGQIPVS